MMKHCKEKEMCKFYTKHIREIPACDVQCIPNMGFRPFCLEVWLAHCSQHWFRQWLVAGRHQVITRTNAALSMGFCGTQLKWIPKEGLTISICKITSFKITSTSLSRHWVKTMPEYIPWIMHMFNFAWMCFCCNLVSIRFTHILQGCSTGTGAIIGLPQCWWSNPEDYG